MKQLPFFIFCLFLMPSLALASSAMKHMSVSPAPVVSSQEAEPQEKRQSQPEQKPTKAKVSLPALSMDKALIKPEELKIWPYMADVLDTSRPEKIALTLAKIENDLAFVPPQALILAAQALITQNRMEEAARYFYLGQVRANFDQARWPPQQRQNITQAVPSRTQDQQQTVPSATTAEIENPHQSLSSLALSVGEPISRWAFRHPQKFKSLLEEVQTLDAGTAYAYLPSYPLTPPRPFSEWPELLKTSRSAYFSRMQDLINSIGNYQIIEPENSFAKPR
jgi:hypothetical protein